MLVRLGYVAMSVNLKNASPSQTMTYKTFSSLDNHHAAIHRLERIAISNLNNCLRLLKHNVGNDIHFFRLSSRLIPLATHEVTHGWKYIRALREHLQAIGDFAKDHDMRLDFHPDHFVVINTPKKDVLKASVETLYYHLKMLLGMGIDPKHRCVLHVGGTYKDKPKSLERFVENWSTVPAEIQQMIILENDDKSFNVQDTLYLCEKLNIPMAFDLHHHLANHIEKNWQEAWPEIVNTWSSSPLPVKMHISSPKSEEKFRHHADFIDSEMFVDFLNKIKGSTSQIDCMIEAKKKDQALFKLVKDLKGNKKLKWVDQSSFEI